MATTEKSSVLLVDDNDATCALVIAILQREFHVEIATDGVEAIEKLKTKSYAALMLDIRMPHLDGFGVLDFLSEHAPAMLSRTLVLTASVTSREMDRTASYPVFGIIAKPFDVEALLNSVRSCAGGSTGKLNGMLSTGMLLLLADLIRQRWI